MLRKVHIRLSQTRHGDIRTVENDIETMTKLYRKGQMNVVLSSSFRDRFCRGALLDQALTTVAGCHAGSLDAVEVGQPGEHNCTRIAYPPGAMLRVA